MTNVKKICGSCWQVDGHSPVCPVGRALEAVQPHLRGAFEEGLVKLDEASLRRLLAVVLAEPRVEEAA